MLAPQTVRREDLRQSAPEQKISNSADFAADVRSKTDDLTIVSSKSALHAAEIH